MLSLIAITILLNSFAPNNNPLFLSTTVGLIGINSVYSMTFQNSTNQTTNQGNGYNHLKQQLKLLGTNLDDINFVHKERMFNQRWIQYLTMDIADCKKELDKAGIVQQAGPGRYT